MQDVWFQFYGVRGSYPVPGKNVIKYGGNTSSVLVTKGDKIIIFDAGTGIIKIGNDLKANGVKGGIIHIFLTHLHLDHIQGLSFFNPIFTNDYAINLYCPDYSEISVENFIYSLFNNPISPISKNGIKAKLSFIKLPLQNTHPISIDGDIQITYRKEDSHPLSGVLLYKLKANGKQVVYATDVESPNGFSPETVDFIRGAQILIHDSQYFDLDYAKKNDSKVGFGHSTYSMAVQNAIRCNVKKLFLFHFDPEYSDRVLENMLMKAREQFKQTFLAKESKKFSIRS